MEPAKTGSAKEKTLGRRALGSALWAGVGRVGRAIAQLLFMIILGRTIGPEGFAATSIALIGYQLTSTIAAQSFSMALVRYSEPDPARDALAFWFNILLTMVPVAVSLACSSFVAKWLGLPVLAWLIPALTAMGLLTAPTVLAQAQLSRTMSFRKVAKIETVSSFCGALLGILGCLLGLGLYALLIYAAAQRVIESAMFLARPGVLPLQRPSLTEARPLLKFTLPLAGMQVLNVANNSVDQFFVGRVGTPVMLGYYSMARRISRQPTQMITFAINRAIFPALVRAKEQHENQAALFCTAVRLAVLIASLPFFLLVSVSDDFLVLAMGPEWAAGAPFLALFAVISATIPVGGVIAATLRAEGRTGRQLIFDLIRFGVGLGTLSILASLGADIWWMAISAAVLSVLGLVLPGWEATRCLELARFRLPMEMLCGILPACVMLATLLGLRHFMLSEAETIVRFSALCILGLIFSAVIGIGTLKRFRGLTR